MCIYVILYIHVYIYIELTWCSYIQVILDNCGVQLGSFKVDTSHGSSLILLPMFDGRRAIKTWWNTDGTLPETNMFAPKNSMVGILVFYWEGLFSGAMLVSGRVFVPVWFSMPGSFRQIFDDLIVNLQGIRLWESDRGSQPYWCSIIIWMNDSICCNPCNGNSYESTSQGWQGIEFFFHSSIGSIASNVIYRSTSK